MNIASYIDHTILKPVTTIKDVEQICKDAIAYSFAAVCVPPCYVHLAKELTKESSVKVATVIGFPFGYNSTISKAQEIINAIENGADELDMVHNIAALKNGDWDILAEEMKACIELVHEKEKKIKVIVESGLLTDEELIKCCEIYATLGIDFMKTSTGYADVGATVHAVEVMRQHLPDTIEIKASGGIRNYTFAKELINAGATRLGCSASVEITKSEALNAKSQIPTIHKS
jgi:deoxyribose-phosphate aldolase